MKPGCRSGRAQSAERGQGAMDKVDDMDDMDMAQDTARS